MGLSYFWRGLTHADPPLFRTLNIGGGRTLFHCVPPYFDHWPNVIKIDPHNFQLYRFKVGAFWDTLYRFLLHNWILILWEWYLLVWRTQAVLFYLPTIIWHGLNSKAGVDADSILAAAHTFSRTDRVENRDRTLKMLVNQMDRFLGSRRTPVARRFGRLICPNCSMFGRRWLELHQRYLGA